MEEHIRDIKAQGIKTIMLSGDNELVAEKVGKLVGMDKVYGDLLPQDKVAIFEKKSWRIIQGKWLLLEME